MSAAVIGIGQTAYSRASQRSEWSLAVEAVEGALADCGISPSDVDGLVRYSYDSVDEAMLVRSFGWRLRYYSQTGYGGLGAPTALAHAAAAVTSGQARIVVCYRSLNGYSRTRYGRAERSFESGGGELVARGDRAPSGAFAGPYGLLSPGQVMAMWARRYQWEAGIAEQDLVGALARIAMDQRTYAQRNPAAVMHGRPLDAAGYLSGRVIATPLRIFDLALETDGAAAVVVAATDVARAASSSPVHITAVVAGIQPGDLSAAMIYDATSISVLLGMEAYGLARPGAGWRAVLEHGIGSAAPVPVNTSGGHLSEAYVHGMNLVVEAVRQCRGTSTAQVQRSGPVLVSSGPSAVVLSP
jgi:acetyl-CoA acetyltransferase